MSVSAEAARPSALTGASAGDGAAAHPHHDPQPQEQDQEDQVQVAFPRPLAFDADAGADDPFVSEQPATARTGTSEADRLAVAPAAAASASHAHQPSPAPAAAGNANAHSAAGAGNAGPEYTAPSLPTGARRVDDQNDDNNHLTRSIQAELAAAAAMDDNATMNNSHSGDPHSAQPRARASASDNNSAAAPAVSAAAHAHVQGSSGNTSARASQRDEAPAAPRSQHASPAQSARSVHDGNQHHGASGRDNSGHHSARASARDAPHEPQQQQQQQSDSNAGASSSSTAVVDPAAAAHGNNGADNTTAVDEYSHYGTTDGDYNDDDDDEHNKSQNNGALQPWGVAGSEEYSQNLHMYLADDTTSAVAPRQFLQGPGTGAFTGVRPYLGRSENAYQPGQTQSSGSGGSGSGANSTGGVGTTVSDPDAAAVKEFISVLEAYLKDCEKKSLYLEAEIAKKRLQELKTHEAQRQLEMLRQRHVTEQIELQGAHASEMAAFDAVWTERIRDFEGRIEVAAYELQQKHEDDMQKELDDLDMKLESRPRFSRDLLQMRKIEASLAKAKDFLEAHRAKLKADAVESRERSSIREDNEVRLALLKQKVVAQQRAEVAAMLQRVEAARARLLRRRQKDLDRFIQRFSNLQNCLAHRQRGETARLATQLPPGMQALVMAPPESLAANGYTHSGAGQQPSQQSQSQQKRVGTAAGGARAGGQTRPGQRPGSRPAQHQQQQLRGGNGQQQQYPAITNNSGNGNATSSDSYALPAVPGASGRGGASRGGSRGSGGALSAPAPGQALFSAPLRTTTTTASSSAGGGAPLAAQAYSLRYPNNGNNQGASGNGGNSGRGPTYQHQQPQQL